MRLGLTLVSTLYLISVFLPVLALPPTDISTPSSLAKRNGRNAFSDIEARSPPHLVVLKKRFIFGFLRAIFAGIGKLFHVIKNAIVRGHGHKHAKVATKGLKGANHAANNVSPPQQQQQKPGGHRRRSLLDPRGGQVYPELGNKMKRSLVHQKRGLNVEPPNDASASGKAVEHRF